MAAKKTAIKRKDLATELEEAFNSSDERGMVIAKGFAARALNITADDIPAELDTPAKLSAWVASLISCAGGIDHFRETYDRLAPKPRRVEVSAPGGGPVRVAISNVESASAQDAARAYFDEIAAGPAGLLEQTDDSPDDGEDFLA